MNLFMDNEFLIFAGPGRLRPALNSGPDPDGAGRDWSGLVGAGRGFIHTHSGSLGSSEKSGVPILWIIGVDLWIICVDMDN